MGVAIAVDGNKPFNRVKVPISLHMLLEIIRQGAVTRSFRCIDGVPKSAVFVGSYYSYEERCGYLVFESDEFEEHSALDEYPRFVPTFEVIREDELEGWE